MFSQMLYSGIDEKSEYNVTIKYKNEEEKQYDAVKVSKVFTAMNQKFSMKNMGMPSLKPLNTKRLQKQKVVLREKDKSKLEIPVHTIQELIIKDPKSDVVFMFKNLTIKAFDEKLNLVTVAENILLPIAYNDAISIYGFKVYITDVDQDHDTRLSHTRAPHLSGSYYFLNHSDSDVAINPVDYSNGMFKTKLISDKFVATLKEVGKDCDAFVKQYDYYNYAKVSQKQAMEFTKNYKAKSKAIKKQAKSLPKKERAAFLEKEYERVFVLNNYIKIIDDYKEKCPE